MTYLGFDLHIWWSQPKEVDRLLDWLADQGRRDDLALAIKHPERFTTEYTDMLLAVDDHARMTA